MDLQVTQENLSKALSHVARIASNRTTLPILNNILIQTDNNRLKLSATNLDIAISQHIGTKIKKDGALTVPARLLQDLVNNLPKSTITLKQVDNKLNISTDNYKSTINGVAIDEYPEMPSIKEGRSIKINAQKVKQALTQVVFASSTDDTRPVLTAVYVYSNNKKLIFASTDSYRLAEKEVSDTDVDISLLVPGSAMRDLLRIISDQAEDIEIIYDEQQVRFLVDDTELIARLIDGTYPDYKKLIPSEFKNKACVMKDELVSVTKVAGLFSRENAGSVTIAISEENGRLSVKSIASQVGENEAKVSGEIIGEDDITLNSHYLLDGLSVFESGKIDFKFNGKLEPIIITNPADKSYTYVVMPLKS